MKAKNALFYLIIIVVAVPAIMNPAAAPVVAVLVVALLIARWVIQEALDLKKSRDFGRSSGMRPSDLAGREQLDERVNQDMTGDEDGGRR